MNLFFIKRKIKQLILFVNPLYRIQEFKMRKAEKLIDLKDLIKHFDGKSIFCFGTGGSIDNLKDVDRLGEKNLMILTTGPLYIYKMYGFVPNLWLLHNPDSIEMFFNTLGDDEIDLSKTFIMVPNNFSDSKMNFDSLIVRKLRKRYPEATFVLYSEVLKLYDINQLPCTYIEKGRQPFVRLKGSAIENIFLPVCSFLGIRKIYFSGVDHCETGHFWNRDHKYQLKDGTSINFSETRKGLGLSAEVAIKYCHQRGIDVYRLEKKETLVLDYPYIEFDKALEMSDRRINPSIINL